MNILREARRLGAQQGAIFQSSHAPDSDSWIEQFVTEHFGSNERTIERWLADAKSSVGYQVDVYCAYWDAARDAFKAKRAN